MPSPTPRTFTLAITKPNAPIKDKTNTAQATGCAEDNWFNHCIMFRLKIERGKI
jgi:hypothetical protein